MGTARVKKARDRRVQLLLSIVQDVARDALKKAKTNLSSATTKPSAPRRRIVCVQRWRLCTSSCGTELCIRGYFYGHARCDEGAFMEYPLPSSTNADEIRCGYTFRSNTHEYLLGMVSK